jgi:hypothetical protein
MVYRGLIAVLVHEARLWAIGERGRRVASWVGATVQVIQNNYRHVLEACTSSRYFELEVVL